MISNEVDILLNLIADFLVKAAREGGLALEEQDTGWQLKKETRQGPVTLTISIERKQDWGKRFARGLSLQATIRKDGKEEKMLIRTSDNIPAGSTTCFFQKEKGKGKEWELNDQARKSFEGSLRKTIISL